MDPLLAQSLDSKAPDESINVALTSGNEQIPSEVSDEVVTTDRLTTGVPESTIIDKAGSIESLQEREKEILKIDEIADESVLSLYQLTGGSEEEFRAKYKNVLQQ